MKPKNILLIFIFYFLFISVISCSKSSSAYGTNSTTGTGSTGANITSVDMNEMAYSPSTVTIKLGTSVKWTNSDYYSAHTATSDDGKTFDSGNIAIGSSYTFTPTVTGTFPYHCLIHGVAMAGTLVVTN